MRKMLENGVHFGHQTRKWNPKMKQFIYTAKNGVYIIDLAKTQAKLEVAYDALKKIAEDGGKILFVGTKKQAQEAIKEEAERCGMYYVNERWLGGMLTNHKTIQTRINKLRDLERMENEGVFNVLPKKEVIKLRAEKEKLEKYLNGIKDMPELPGAIFVVDPRKENIAIQEAHRLGIPVIGIVDTNCDPDELDFAIPGNDDAIRAVKLITGAMATAIIEGRQAIADEAEEVSEDQE